MSNTPTKIAIACQGGGSHTAFTAGVLEELLPWIQSRDCELVGLSGTSGGAVCGTAAWAGYLEDGAAGAVEALEAIWDDIAATDPISYWINTMAVWNSRARNTGAPVPTISPYSVPFDDVFKQEFERILRRHIDFEALPSRVDEDTPRMFVGTVDVQDCGFKTFTDAAITPRAILASAAIPTLFEGSEIDGNLHWDGLFSQNPPVKEFITGDLDDKPDELWIIQINPQRIDEKPKSLRAIHDRKNELSGNLSLNQELRFIEQVNRWVADGHLPTDRYKHIEIRRTTLDRELDHSSKLKCDADFIEELKTAGREDAQSFLAEVEADLFQSTRRPAQRNEKGSLT